MIGVHYECESSNGFFETMFNHAKRMIFKTIEHRRETDHGKKLSLTASNDQVKKINQKNLQHLKAKKVSLMQPNLLNSRMTWQDTNTIFCQKHGRSDCQVEVKAVLPKDKPFPKLPRQ